MTIASSPRGLGLTGFQNWDCLMYKDWWWAAVFCNIGEILYFVMTHSHLSGDQRSQWDLYECVSVELIANASTTMR